MVGIIIRTTPLLKIRLENGSIIVLSKKTGFKLGEEIEVGIDIVDIIPIILQKEPELERKIVKETEPVERG